MGNLIFQGFDFLNSDVRENVTAGLDGNVLKTFSSAAQATEFLETHPQQPVIFPSNRGAASNNHTLIIPNAINDNEQPSDILDFSPEALQKMINLMQLYRAHLKESKNLQNSFNMAVQNGPSAGQTIKRTNMHLLDMNESYDNDALINGVLSWLNIMQKAHPEHANNIGLSLIAHNTEIINISYKTPDEIKAVETHIWLNGVARARTTKDLHPEIKCDFTFSSYINDNILTFSTLAWDHDLAMQYRPSDHAKQTLTEVKATIDGKTEAGLVSERGTLSIEAASQIARRINDSPLQDGYWQKEEPSTPSR